MSSFMAEVSEIEKKRTPLEYEIHVKPGSSKGLLISVGSKQRDTVLPTQTEIF
jgi:hypothetical protein